VRLQRTILSSRWWGAPVTVYGYRDSRQDQPAHVIPFFTSVLTQEQMARARAAAERQLVEQSTHPLRLLYVGRLSASKNVDVLLSAVATLRQQGINVCCNIVGDGPERQALERQVQNDGLGNCVSFAGGVDFEKVLDFYERADVLVLASETEGWPKAIAEAMAFGLVCIGADRGLVPWMLGEGRGLLVTRRDTAALVNHLRRLTESLAEFRPMRAQAAAWAQQYSLEGLRDALGELLREHWHVPIGLPLTAARQNAL
jgi:glycosyltransferase involved in cell wall biosynthesis